MESSGTVGGLCSRRPPRESADASCCPRRAVSLVLHAGRSNLGELLVCRLRLNDTSAAFGSTVRETGSQPTTLETRNTLLPESGSPARERRGALPPSGKLDDFLLRWEPCQPKRANSSSLPPSVSRFARVSPRRSQEDSLQDLVLRARDRVSPALVNVQPITDVYSSGERRSSTGVGSGFIFDRERARHHELPRRRQGQASHYHFQQQAEGARRLVGGDPLTDVAVLEARARPGPERCRSRSSSETRMRSPWASTSWRSGARSRSSARSPSVW